jgi:D-alanyl-D-alanine carboxypeptidase
MLFGLVGLFTIMHWTVEKIAGLQAFAYGNEIATEYDLEMINTENKTEDDPLLVLVNKDNELSEDYDSNLQSICGGRLEASEYLYEDLCAMLSDAKEAGYEYWIASAYRSRQRQQELVDEDVEALMQKGYSYEDALTETYRETMPAGHSEHETGLALDILCSGNTNMDITQADEPGNRWLLAHCSEYGFILRYPSDKEDVTGISYEPWHFRYVGKEAAQYIMGNGITLEEY